MSIVATASIGLGFQGYLLHRRVFGDDTNKVTALKDHKETENRFSSNHNKADSESQERVIGQPNMYPKTDEERAIR